MDIEVPCYSNFSLSDKFRDFGVGVLQLAAFWLLLELLIDRLPKMLFEPPDFLDL
jgi:hypothetical protein